MASAKAKAQQMIAEYPILVVKRDGCPFCNATEATFEKALKGKNPRGKYKLFNVSKEDPEREIHAAFKELTSHGTFPNIFINHKPIGGNSDLDELKASGDLDKLIEEALAA